jgi:cold shock protein
MADLSNDPSSAQAVGAPTGTIRWFNATKGFGFITPDAGGADVFIHISAVEAAGRSGLIASERVQYTLFTARGRTSARLRVLDDQTIVLPTVALKSVFNNERLDDLTSPGLIVGPEQRPIDLLSEPKWAATTSILEWGDAFTLPGGRIETPSEQIDSLIRRIQTDPALLREIHPGQFETLVAVMLQKEGYETELVSKWNEADGGVDIIAVYRLSGGLETRFAIQCKHTRNKVSATPIRALNGVLDRFKAHQGIVATTSFFTKSAALEVQTHHWKVSLRDFDNIIASLKAMQLVAD